MINDATTKGTAKKMHPARFSCFIFCVRRPEKIDNRSASMSSVSACGTVHPFCFVFFILFFIFSLLSFFFFPGHVQVAIIIGVVVESTSWGYKRVFEHMQSSDTRNERVKWLTTTGYTDRSVAFFFFYKSFVQRTRSILFRVLIFSETKKKKIKSD